jgi:hypothetical protein
VLPLATGDGPFSDHPSSLPADPLRAEKGITALSIEVTRRGYLRGYLSLSHSERDIRETAERLYESLRRCAPAFA